jgi:hypothetical protein
VLAIVPLQHIGGHYPDGVILYGRLHAATLWIAWSIALVLAAIAAWKLARIDYRIAIALQVVLGMHMAIGLDLAPSSDAYIYQFYGGVVAQGKSPWGSLQLDPATTNPLERLVIRLYGDHPVPSIYGPAFLDPESLLARATAAWPLHQRLVAQRLAALAAAAFLVLAIPKRRRAIWALNPFILFECAAGGHNDVFMLLALAGAIRLRKLLPAGIAFGVAVLVKASAAAAIVVRPRLAFGAALVFAAFAIVQPSAFDFRTVLEHVRSPVYSALLTPLFHRFGLVPALPFFRIAIVLGLFAAFVAMRKRKRDRPIPLALAIVAIPPLTAPWYGLWVAFSGAWAHRRAFTLAWWIPAILWPLYLIFWY